MKEMQPLLMKAIQASAAAFSLVLAAALAQPASAFPVARAGEGVFVLHPLLSRVVDRPAMHSYQPYSGLQFGFRPQPPAELGVRDGRPRVVKPKRVTPLVEYGNAPAVSLGYAYCAEGPSGTMEPVAGPYDPQPVEPKQCP